jgi:hypothetical protein
MLLGRNLPKFLWAEALSYTTWLKNCLPSRAIPGHTLHSLVHGTVPDLSMAHEFGTPCFVHIQDGGKLDARAEEAISLGLMQKVKATNFTGQVSAGYPSSKM